MDWTDWTDMTDLLAHLGRYAYEKSSQFWREMR